MLPEKLCIVYNRTANHWTIYKKIGDAYVKRIIAFATWEGARKYCWHRVKEEQKKRTTIAYSLLAKKQRGR